ncbi:TauD/TfdA family dioxygenase [Candidatus Pelagibacter sp.]|nr:TauD/TfdA family dioxygenase [Candidatus Pelagibacter sp.]
MKIIKSQISELILGKGTVYEALNDRHINKLNIIKIKKEFNEKGLILLRNFQFNVDELNKFTDNFSLAYANDAIRRKKRFEKKNIRNVDSGLKKIDLHSEASFSPSVPDLIWFICISPPQKKGGKTILCDGIKLWDSLDLKTREFFLANQIHYKLKIPFENKIFNKKSRKWLLPYPGVENCIINYKKSLIEFNYFRFAAETSRQNDKLAFANHLFVTLKSEPQIISRTLRSGKEIPKKIIQEIKNKSQKLTFKINWSKNDIIMIDNKRFLHGREKISENDKRDIVIIQTLKSNF